MKTVWKYKLQLADKNKLELPNEGIPLYVAIQNAEICLWVLVDDELSGTVTRHFRIASTGHAISENIKKYIGTIIMYSGALVFHVFEVEE